jgi:hypothetical protein
MDKTALNPQNFTERLVYWSIVLTWLFYLIGGLYLLAPALGWILFLKILLNNYVGRKVALSSVSVWIWCAGMLAMLAALIAGHILWGLGVPQLIKSTIGWAKGWALLALFILAGAMLPIRMMLLARAVNILALQTLLLIPLFYLAPKIGLPGTLYISPLSILGGPGPEFFEVQLYGRGAGDLAARWRFFSPWAPAAGMVANTFVILSMMDRNHGWKVVGVLTSVLVCLMSQSRLALIAILVVPATTWVIVRFGRPFITIFIAGGLGVSGLLSDQLIALADMANDRFVSARAASSRVRAALGRIAVDRWSNEALWFGHGVVEKGPHLVEYMPIGSHHTWYGLLFVKGIVGFVGLAIPMLATFVELVAKAQTNRIARSGLAMTLVLLMYSFGENLEILAYLFWPGLLLIGKSLSVRYRSPFRNYLAG